MPYSPELNPIEEVFSVIRKDMIVGLQSLLEYLPKLFEELNNTLDFSKFYKHAFYWTKKHVFISRIYKKLFIMGVLQRTYSIQYILDFLFELESNILKT